LWFPRDKFNEIIQEEIKPKLFNNRKFEKLRVREKT
jgi:hypothetical protein